MSRYTFEGSAPGTTIVVGWDNPLQTYFAQVWEGSDPPDGVLALWVGIIPEAVPTIARLAARVAHFGEIPADIVEQLEEDFEERVEPTPLQKLLTR